MLNVVELIVCVLIIIILVFYFFFWNRFFAFLFSVLVRFALWNQEESSIWIKLGSIHFSLLGGRILIKDLRYHSSNQTFRIVKGQISWRYWLRRPAEEEDLSHARVIGEDTPGKEQSPLACRVHISLQGLEWFIYNRTAAFDNIVSQLDPDVPVTPVPTPNPDGTASMRKIFSRSSVFRDPSLLGPPVSLVSSIYKRTPTFVKRGVSWMQEQLPNLDPKDLLPISIEVVKGAITVGNASTPNLLAAEFQRGEGTYGIVESRSKQDLYKQVLNFKVQNVSMSYVENENYTSPMVEIGRRTHETINRSETTPLRRSSYLSYGSFQRVWQHLRLWTTFQVSVSRAHTSTSVGMAHPQTWGRRKQHKSVDEATPLGADFSTLEYAVERKILEASMLELLYYADVVGVVPPSTGGEEPQDESLDPFDIGNGDLPPEWGIDLLVRGGTIRYGPWADRQRATLQHAFFPPTFADSLPTPRLKPGDMRMWTGMKVFIELRDGVTLQLPFREASKNWQWDGKAEVKDRPRKREAASIHVRAGDSSTISYIVPMVATVKGYQSVLEVHLDTITVTSSLNDIRLLTAETCRVRSHMPSPLKWNGLRQWSFAVSLRQPCLYLLRDHVNMLTDLGKDWSTGPPSDYNLFTPMIYAIDLDMHNYDINLYVNDHNIIDKPLLREENALLTLRGTHLVHGIHMPFDRYRPQSTDISLWLDTPDINVSIHLPRWNMLSLSATPDRSQIGRIGMLNMKGSYRYLADVKPEHVDQLKLEFFARDVVYKAFGWTIRYFMVLRDNYFGAFTHFSTLTEYLSKRGSGQPLGDPILLQYREAQSNAMQVILTLEVDNGLIVLPAGYPGYEKFCSEERASPEDLGPCLLLSLPKLQLHLRTNDFYMEMSLNIDTIGGRISDHCYNDSILTSNVRTSNGREKIIIDGLDIVANRLFGPRPATSTYVCIWEIRVGDVKASLSPYEIAVLSSVGSAFGLNFSDPLNAPAKEYAIPSDPDVTFLKVQVESVNAVWVTGGAAAELTLPRGLRLDMNDLAGKSFRKVTSLRLPEATVRIILASRQDRTRWIEVADARVDVNLDLYSAPPGWQESARRQADFIAEQDHLTGRAKILYMEEEDPACSSRLRPGRGILDNDFYLPQIRIPRISPVQTMHDRHGIPLTSLREDVSESDVDPLPESVRDARLADLRPPHIPAGLLSDDDISSGDESDNDGLTDWSTDYEDMVEMEDPSQPTWPQVNQYTTHCRHYESHSLTQPASWPTSPFVLTRDISQSRHSSEQGSFSSTPLSGPAIDGLGPQVHDTPPMDKDTYRIHSSRGIYIWTTPLILPAVVLLLKDFGARQLSPELRIDGLAMNYIKAFKERPLKVDMVTYFDVQLPTIELRSLQLINAASQHGNFQPGDAFLTVTEVISTGVHLRARLQTSCNGLPDRAIASAFTSFSAKLLSKSSIRQSSKQDFSTQCQLSIGPTSVTTMGEQLAVSLGLVSANISHTGPDLTLATVVSLARCASGLVMAHRDLQTHAPANNRQLVHGILTVSRQRSVVDPLSTIQPSYLVQDGLPDRLRKDITWKFLVYLRYSLRFLDERERQTVQSVRSDTDNPVSIEEVLATLQNQWFGVGGDDDSSDTTQQSLLQVLLHTPPLEPSPKADRWKLPYDALTLTLTGISLALCHPGSSAQSGFTTGMNTVTLHHRPMDLVQAPIGSPNKSYSVPAGREREKRPFICLAVCLSLDNISCKVYPQAVQFIQIALREYRHHRIALYDIAKSLRPPHSPHPNKPSIASRPASPSRKPPTTLSFECTLSMRSFSFTAATEKLVVRFKNAGVSYASNLLAKLPSKEQPRWDISTNQSLMFQNAIFEACAASGTSPAKEHVLASLSFTAGRTNVVLQQDIRRDKVLHVFFGLGKLHLEVPRSALRLYRFIEGWRSDYLPGLDATVRALLAELRGPPSSPQPSPSHASHSLTSLNFQVQASVDSVQATLQVMHGTWLSWEVHETMGSLSNDNRRRETHVFGLQMGSHVFSISRTRSTAYANPNSSIRLEFPTMTLRGRHDNAGLQGMALVNFFHVTVRPSDWDTLLSVQQKSGQDFNDLLHIIEQTRQRSAVPTGETDRSTGSSTKPAFKFHGSLKMKGFRVGLEGLSSTVLLECDDISGGIGNHTHSLWHVKLTDLALSLASRLPGSGPSERDRRSAFVRVDFETHMQSKPNASVPHLEVAVAKAHAVMQPSSIGELGDFIDHLQAEVLIRKEQRASELEEFKEKTRSLMRTLDVKIGEQAASEKSLLELYTMSLVISHVGVAFPLSLTRDLQMPRSGSQDDASVRAFLFSIKSISFASNLGENGQASMTNFAFQFVSRFRQGVPADFSGESHKTRNRLLYPDMTAEARSERIAGSRRVSIAAQVSGFILDVDSTIPDFISSLLDVYRRGKDRVERLSGGASRLSPSTESVPHIDPTPEAHYGALPTSNILASLTFASGKVRMHSKESSSQHRRGVLSTLVYGRGEDMTAAEEFNLPVVSVWGEFRATPAVYKLVNSAQPAEPSTLVFKSTIHSSQNTLRPSLLLFLAEIMTRVEGHMRSSNWKGPQASPGPRPYSLPPAIAPTEELPARIPQADPVSSMKISFSLRIDQSKLHFTCRPDANVIAGLYWESGGFIINISPGARRVSFTGTVGGLTVALKHGFLSEDCVRLDARNLNFSMAFARVQPTQGRISSSISIVLDTEFSGGIRFSRLQDVLCFKAVWLDRIPAFTGAGSTPSDRPSNPPSALLAPQPSIAVKQELTTAVLLRFRRVELDVDLGQSISNIKLTLDDALFRTKITEVLSELSLSIEQFTIVASGNLSGHADLPNFQFQTIRRNNSHHAKEAGGRMLDLSMTTGVFIVKLDSEFHELIQYRAEPISVYIYDDWSRVSSDITADDRHVHLNFIVSGSDVLAIMTVGTIPKLVSYVNKFRMNLDAQREGASRESQAFRIANQPKPENPLSTVANAMFKTARSRLKESEAGICYVVAQRMSLELGHLQLIVFPRSMRDAELAQFVGANIHARLQRIIEGDDDPSKRDLRLHFSAISISKISHLHHTLIPKDRSLDTLEWLKRVVTGSPEATIFGLPSMSMHMQSVETPNATQRVLAYDFKSSFEKAGVTDAEDIYISLNMALYSWLTVLRKTFAREMEQVQAAMDARAVVGLTAGVGIGAQAALSHRKKTHEIVGTTARALDDGNTPESTGSLRTRSRARGSISSRTVPTAARSMDDITVSAPLAPLKISTTHVGSSKLVSPISATSSMEGASKASSGSGPSGAAPPAPVKKTKGLTYEPHDRKIERLTMRQLGEATPDVMHPFFMKKAGFNLEDSLPQYVHEYATMPTEEIMKALLKLYSKQLTRGIDDPSLREDM